MLRSTFPVGLLLLGSVWALGTGPGVAQDKAPRSEPLNPRMLGMTEALLDYCAKNDPSGGAKVRARLKRLVQGADKKALTEARKSTEYRSAHDSEAVFISKVEPRNARRLCSEPAGRSP
jgi:hypothetical protein